MFVDQKVVEDWEQILIVQEHLAGIVLVQNKFDTKSTNLKGTN